MFLLFDFIPLFEHVNSFMTCICRRELDDEYGKQEMSSSTDSLQRENELLQRRLEESERRYREQTAQIRDLEDFQRDIVEENKHLEAALKQVDSLLR